MIERSYLFSLNYGERTKEKQFIKDILTKYDSDKLVGAGIYVNNNPYDLQLHLCLNFHGESDFEEWLVKNYPSKRRSFNYFHGDICESIPFRGYSVATFVDDLSVDLIVTPEHNDIFLFPEKQVISSIWNSTVLKNEIKVFLSHSSNDKKYIDTIFNELQVNEIRAWYDKYEIWPGDSIVEKINEGLENSDIGIICISRNFLDSSTGWTKSELNYFIQRRMRSNKKDFICLNLDVPHDELPPLVQDYKYIDIREPNAINLLVESLKRI